MVCLSLTVNLYTYPDGKLGVQESFLDGELHNPFGPAVQFWDNKGNSLYKEFWIDNNCISEEQFHKSFNTSNSFHKK